MNVKLTPARNILGLASTISSMAHSFPCKQTVLVLRKPGSAILQEAASVCIPALHLGSALKVSDHFTRPSISSNGRDIGKGGKAIHVN